MASVKKFQSKNFLKHSVNDAEKIREKERISSVLKNFNNNSKEKSNDKLKFKKSDNLKNINNLNFFKNPKYITTNSISNNNNCNNSNVNTNTNLSTSIKNSNVSYIEVKNSNKGVNLKTNNFTNTFNLNYCSQKLLQHNNQNLTNNSQINNSGLSNNWNLNFSLKNPKDLTSNGVQDISMQNINNMLYLSTEPEKTEFDFSNASFNQKGIKVFKNSNAENGTNNINNININKGNSNLTSVYNNFLRTNPSKNVKILNTMNNCNFANDNQLLINKLKKASFLSNYKNTKKHLNLTNNLSSNNVINNTDISLNNNFNQTNNIIIGSNYRKRNSNSKNTKKSNSNNPFNTSNTNNNNNNSSKINISTNNIPKNPQSPSPIPTYSSPNDFIEDFFKELQNYCVNLERSTQKNQNLNQLNILNIFDNIFKNIITGEKPMETLDIYIKKKLSNYSEIWKKFLLAYEKMAVNSNAAKNPNPNYINNIDLSTKNVINHNHNHNITTTTGNEAGCFPQNFISGKNCVQNLKAELEEKFTNLMKTEVNKIKEIVGEKEKIIDDLLKEINIKNSYISEMQDTLNNLKSKDGMTSHSLLFSDYFLKENLQENNLSTINKNYFPNNKSNLKNDNSNNFNLSKQIKHSSDLFNNNNNNNNNLNKMKSNKNLQNVLAPSFIEKKEDNMLNTLSNNNLLIAINSDSLEENAPVDESKLDLIELNDFNIDESNNNIYEKMNHSINDQNNKSKDNNATGNNKIIQNFNNAVIEQSLSLYDQKQFIREKRMLASENKTLFDKLNEMEKQLNFQKEKEIKLMKVLFFLNKQGIPIDEIIQNQLLTEKSEIDEPSQINRENNFTPLESSKSMDSLMYLPLTLEKPNPYTKPEVIPVLNLRDINNKFNLEYGSAKKPNKDVVCITDPSYLDQNNNVKKSKNFNNYLIEENHDVDDHYIYVGDNNLVFGNKIQLNNKAKINNYLKKINHNNTIQNDFENKDFMQIANKSTIKENLKINKGLSKNLQFRNIQNRISPILTKNGSEKESQYLTQELPQKVSMNNINKNLNKERTSTKDKINNLNNKNDNHNSSVGKRNPNNAIWSNYNKNKNNQDSISNKTNFKIFSYNIQKDKNTSVNKSLGDNKKNFNQNQNLTNISNYNPENTSELNNQIYLNTSLKKHSNKTPIHHDIHLIYDSPNKNITDCSVIKHNDERLKLNLNFSVKDKMKNILKNQQRDSSTKIIESSLNPKNK